jgi:hypothetical protein
LNRLTIKLVESLRGRDALGSLTHEHFESMQSSSAATALARRATQCSFSSAFHAQLAPEVQAVTNRVYTWLLVPVLVLGGAIGAYRLDRQLRENEVRRAASSIS